MRRIALHYQPVVDMRTGELIGIEALARWTDALYGNIPVGEFVALAEDSGQIIALGRHVLFEACRQLGDWRARDHQLATFSVAVNVSARQLDDAHFFAHVEQASHESGLPASGLVLELTESAMLHPHPHLRALLDRLRRFGVRLALDDFGAGYSSLSYLHRFPFDVLTIDRALVERVGYSDDGSALVRAVLSVAEALNLSVIAEGIEDRVQQDELLRIGCNLGQGYLLGAPMPAQRFLEWLANDLPAAISLAE
jgi:EAL domain-containing protein (putative c-di-GMP-specific phosphodiesterase class I)